MFPAQLNLHNSSCTSSKRAPASLAALNSPICKDLLLLRVPHRSRADTVKYKSNGLWRSSWQSRWAGGVDQDVRMRTKRRGWWWRGGTRGHKALHPIAIRLDWNPPPAFSALGKIHHLVLALLSDDAPLSCWVFIIYSAEACTLWPTLSGDPRILLLGLVSAHYWSVGKFLQWDLSI